MASFFLLPLGTAATPSTVSAPQQLETLAISQINQALKMTLPQELRHALKLEIEIVGRRGAAQRPCPTGWALEDIPTAQPWKRLPITVRCNTQKGSVVARINAQAPVWVLRGNVPAGQALTERDVLRSQRRINGADEVQPLSALTGLQLRRDRVAGHTVHPSDVERPIVAHKGDQIEIRASNAEGVSVNVAGIATKLGRLGDHHRVRNARSQQWVSGTWVGPRLFEADHAQPTAGRLKVVQESRD